VCLSGYVLDHSCACWGLIELRELVPPWSLRVSVRLDLLPQIAETLPCVRPWALVLPIATRPLTRGGTGTGGRSPAPLTARGAGQPLGDSLGLRHTIVRDDAREAGHG